MKFIISAAEWLYVIAGFVFVLAIFLLLTVGVPFVFVWALNSLFPVLAIPYNVQTWLASLIILAILKGKHDILDKQEKK